ncbi:hypothetical protein [Desulfovibrio sp. Huiquan2017]|uniref:hypothetical protein n=1 Tax=Desulfovibrio sp. Huiquan2017 TaxID=2816861 RepID=UPI001A92FACE|nr:hypothetical protein [Desulfovibrio sp. Huiquan2017]
MSKPGVVAVALCVWLVVLVGSSAAFEVDVPCESVKIIYVGKGRRHLSDGKVEAIYGASVMLEKPNSNLIEARLNCPHGNVLVRVGASSFELPKDAVSTGGDWFSVDYSNPEEALDAAMRMCPEKVKSFLP